MEASIQKVMDMYYHEEVRHFRESFDEDEIFFYDFVSKLKEHVLYDLIVICFKGDEKLIQDEIQDLYEQTKMILECV